MNTWKTANAVLRRLVDVPLEDLEAELRVRTYEGGWAR